MYSFIYFFIYHLYHSSSLFFNTDKEQEVKIFHHWANPSDEPILINHQFDPWQPNSVKFKSKYIYSN